ncbi:MAG: maltokinase N-terminal cap-like domain-containing protein [Acidimicrobiales bacterium]
MIEPRLLAAHLGQQRWFAGPAPETVEVEATAVLLAADVEAGRPGLVRMVVASGGHRWQLVLGVRPAHPRPAWLSGHEAAVVAETDHWPAGVVGDAPAVGAGDAAAGPVLVYDAVYDPELASVLLAGCVDGLTPSRSRVLAAEQSNTSVVFDESVILKLFRRLVPAPNPEVEVTSGLGLAGFDRVAVPLGMTTRWGSDLAVAQPYLAGGVDGWALALTSLRDLLGSLDTQELAIIDPSRPPPPPDPHFFGGDFSSEARRLGQITAELHRALALRFGEAEGDAAAWAGSVGAEIAAVEEAEVDRAGASRVIEDLARAQPGRAIRVHGDYHLGQVMRTDSGWFVLDFEGEPARPVEQRRQPTSPLRDVAGMLRSFHYAAGVAAGERGPAAADAAGAWERANRAAFLQGYEPAAVEAGLIPDDSESRRAVLAAFELEKAVYELAYERAHRPHWEAIPAEALRRLTRQ